MLGVLTISLHFHFLQWSRGPWSLLALLASLLRREAVCSFSSSVLQHLILAYSFWPKCTLTLAAVTVKCVLNNKKPVVGLCQHSIWFQQQIVFSWVQQQVWIPHWETVYFSQIIKAEDTMLALQGVKVRPVIGVKGLHVKLAKCSLLSEECFNERCVKINSRVSAE